jgi:hypothetical protein
MRNVDFPTDHTPEEWRAMASNSNRTAAESWERSDTDGFLSQWANQKMAAHYLFMADVAADEGKWNFIALADLDGNLLDAKIVDGKYGPVWCIRQADGSAKWFNESSARKGATRQAAHTKKGYRLVLLRQDAVYVWGEGTGSGLQPKRDTEGVVIGEIEYKDF